MEINLIKLDSKECLIIFSFEITSSLLQENSARIFSSAA
jgi:hypothetical protein